MPTKLINLKRPRLHIIFAYNVGARYSFGGISCLGPVQLPVFYHDRTLISRATGGSPVRSGAYRHAQKVVNELTGEAKNYSGKAHEVVHEEMILPHDAPQWARDRYLDVAPSEASNRLWHDIERRELSSTRAAKAQYAYSYTLALPRELTRDQQIELLREYVSRNLISNGEIADVVIHDKLDGNPHAHVMTTRRFLDEAGFGGRVRDYRSRTNDTVDLRYAWAVAANAALEAAGIDARIDHRKMVDQGIELEAISYSPYIEASAEAAGESYRIKERVLAGRAANDAYLRANPDHILLVVARDVGPLFTVADVRATLQRYVPPSVGVAELDEMVERVRGGSEMVVTTQRGAGGVQLYTTRAALEVARGLEASVLSLASSELDLSQSEGREVPELSEALSGEQRRAAEAMISARRIAVVNGFAGAGKTFTMLEASKVWDARGVAVLGAAVSGRAVQELSGLSGQVATVAQWEARWDRGELPPAADAGGFVLFLDEAGMMGTGDMARFVGRVETLGGKVVLVGAREQLGPIQDTAAFAHVAQLAGAVTLEEVRRQNDPIEAQAVAALSRGGDEIAPALDAFAARGCFRFEETQAAAIAQIAEHFFEGDAKPSGRLALAHSNLEVAALNAAIRKEAVRRGEIDRGRTLMVGSGPSEIELAVGDRVLFTRAYPLEGITKSSFAQVMGVSGSHLLMSVDGRSGVVEIDTREFARFDYGYAATVHKAQGMTVDGTVDVLFSPMFDWHLTDVALSRHKQGLRVWAGRDGVRDLNQIKMQAQRSSLIDVTVGGREAALRRAHEHIDHLALGQGRLDRVVDIAPQTKMERVSFVGDAHLSGIARRFAGLLAAEFEPGMAAVRDDARGYAQDPLRVVDDLIARSGVVRASEVAGLLSEVIAEPDMFAGAFARAMSHPDLVILSDDGLYGEGRVYTTRAAMAQSVGVVDRAVLFAGRGPSAAGGVTGAERAAYFEAAYPESDIFADWRDRLRGLVATDRLAVIEAHGWDQLTVGSMRYSGVSATIAGAAGAALGKEQGMPGMVYFAHPRADVAAEVDARLPFRSHSLAEWGVLMRDGVRVMEPGSTVVIPDADRLDAAQLAAVFDFAEEADVRVFLHHDPAVTGGGAHVRAIADRVGLHSFEGDYGDGKTPARAELVLDGLSGAVEGVHLSDVYEALWRADLVSGGDKREVQEQRFAQIVIARVRGGERPEEAFRGLARSRTQCDALNVLIDRGLVGSGEEALVVAREGRPDLRLCVGSHVIERHLPDAYGFESTGIVRAIDLEARAVTIEKPSGALVEVPEGRLGALDYAYVRPIDVARRGRPEGEVLLFADRHMGRADLIAAAHMGEIGHLSVPVDPDAAGAGAAYLEGVADRGGARGVLDYGFDPARAQEAAQAAEASRLDIAAMAARERIAGDDLAVMDRLRAGYVASPERLAAQLSRAHGRFTAKQFLDAYVAADQAASSGGDAGEERARAALDGLVQDGYVIEGQSVGSGAAGVVTSYVSWGQAAVEARAHSLGVEMIAQGGLALWLEADGVDPRGFGGDQGVVVVGANLAEARAGGERLRTQGIVPSEVMTLSQLERGFAQSSGRSSGQSFGGRDLLAGAREIVVAGAEKLGAGQWGRLLSRAQAHEMRVTGFVGSAEAGGFGGVSLARVWLGDVAREDVSVSDKLEVLNLNGKLNAQADMGGLANSLVRSYWDGQVAGSADGVVASHILLAGSRGEADRFERALRAAGVARGLIEAPLELKDQWGSVHLASVGQVFSAQADIDVGGTTEIARGDVVRVKAIADGKLVLEGLRGGDAVVAVDHAAVQLRMADTVYSAARVQAARIDIVAGHGMGAQGLGVVLGRDGVALHYAQDRFPSFARLRAGLTVGGDKLAEIERLWGATEVVPITGAYLEVAAAAGRNTPVVAPLSAHDDPQLVEVMGRTVARLQAAARAREDAGEGVRVLSDDPRAFEIVSDPARVIDQILAERSVLRADDVARMLMRFIEEPRAFAAAFEEAMTHPDLVVLVDDDGAGGGAVYSSLTHIKREAALAGRVDALARARSAFAPGPDQIEAAIAGSRLELAADQVAAVRHLTDGARFGVLTGSAGTGKSAVMAVSAQAYEAAGWKVYGATVSARAARGFEAETGIKSQSLGALVHRVGSGRVVLDAHSVVMVDDAGLVGQPDWARLLDVVERAGASVIVNGDGAQLAPRGPGAMFRVFEARVGSAHLSRVWRQRDALDAQASIDLGRGGADAAGAVAHFAARGVLIGTHSGDRVGMQAEMADGARSDEDLHLQAAVAGYLADPHIEKSLIAYTRADVARLNKMVREALRAGHDGEEMLVDVGGRFLSEPVAGASPDISARVPLAIGIGDRLQFSENDYKRGVFNGEIGEVMALNAEKGQFIVKIGDGDEARHVALPREGGPAFGYGYARSVHASMGRSEQSTHYVMRATDHHAVMNVAASRYRDQLRIYVPALQGEAEEFARGVAARRFESESLVQEAYGFGDAPINDAVSDGVAQAFWQQHMGDVPERLSGLERLFGKRDPARSAAAAALAKGAAGLAMRDLSMGAMAEVGALPNVAQQKEARALLAEVSTGEEWAQIARRLPRVSLDRIHGEARRATNIAHDQALLPEAVALARAAAVARFTEDYAMAEIMERGLRFTGLRAQTAKDYGIYKMVLAEAYGPKEAERARAGLRQDMIARDQDRFGPRMGGGRGVFNPLKYPGMSAEQMGEIAAKEIVSVVPDMMGAVLEGVIMAQYERGVERQMNAGRDPIAARAKGYQAALQAYIDDGLKAREDAANGAAQKTAKPVAPEEPASEPRASEQKAPALESVGPEASKADNTPLPPAPAVEPRKDEPKDQPAVQAEAETGEGPALQRDKNGRVLEESLTLSPVKEGANEYFAYGLAKASNISPSEKQAKRIEAFEDQDDDFYWKDRAELLERNYPIEDIDVYFETVGSDIPQAWIERQAQRIQNFRDPKAILPFKSNEEFEWALAHTVDQSIRLHLGTSQQERETVAQWREAYLNGQLTKSSGYQTSREQKKWERSFEMFIRQEFNVSRSEREWGFVVAQQGFELNVQPRLAKENVPDAWKTRLEARVRALGNGAPFIPAAQSFEEFKWATKLIAQAYVSRKGTHEPPSARAYFKREYLKSQSPRFGRDLGPDIDPF